MALAQPAWQLCWAAGLVALMAFSASLASVGMCCYVGGAREEETERKSPSEDPVLWSRA